MSVTTKKNPGDIVFSRRSPTFEVVGFEDLDEGLDHFGVERAAVIFADARESLCRREGLSEKAFVGVHVEGVGYGDDPTLDGDLIALQASRQPCAIKPFLMFGEPRESFAESP